MFNVGPPTLFLETIAKRGYVQGQNFELVEPPHSYETREKALAVIRWFDEQQVVMLRTTTNSVIQAVAAYGWRKPVVFGSTSLSVLLQDGLIESLVRPGKNYTGMATDETNPIESRAVELLLEAIPSLRRIAIFNQVQRPDERNIRGDSPLDPALARSLNPITDRHGITIQSFDVVDSNDVSVVFEQFAADAVFRRGGGPAITEVANRIIAECRERRLPSVGTIEAYAFAGGLMTYGPDSDYQGVRLAEYVADILDGANPATLPVEIGRQFRLVLNRTTLRALGLTLSSSFSHQVTHLVD